MSSRCSSRISVQRATVSAITAPEGTTLFAFEEDFLGEAYEVEESDEPAAYIEQTEQA